MTCCQQICDSNTLSINKNTIAILKNVGLMTTNHDDSFKQLIDHSPLAIAVHQDQKWVYVNQAGLTLLKISKLNEFIGWSIYEFIHPAYHEIEKERLFAIEENKIEENKIEENKNSDHFLEEIFFRSDGTIVDVEVAANAIVFQQKKSVQVIIRDISKRKQEEQELKNSEKRYRLLFEFAPDAYYLSDLKGNIVDGNKALENITGFNKRELIGINLLRSNLLTSEQVPKAAEMLFKNSMGKSTPPKEFTFHRKDGSLILVEIRAFPLRLRSRALVLGIARDISSRRKAEKELQESEERFRRLSEATFEGVLLSEGDKILDANSTLAKMLGYELSEMLSMNVLDVYAETTRDTVSEYIHSGYEQQYETMALRKDQSSFPIEVLSKAAPFRGGIIKITAIRDITERKRVEQLREDTERIVRHDLKNPLNGIIGFAELVLSEQNYYENDKIVEWMSRIKDMGFQTLRMINHSLSLFKMEEGTYYFNPDAIDLVQLFKKLHEEFQNLQNMASTEMVYFLNQQPLSWESSYLMMGEQLNLESLFANIIKNALEATPAHSKINISISDTEFHQDDETIDAVLIDIHNAGTIPDDIRDRFFERYVTSGKEGGTGLGTYSAYLITNAHNGKISYTSSEKEGTHLLVTLPKYHY